MCILSDKIKFCTCPSDVRVEELPQYWILNRYNRNKDELVIGSALMPTSLRDLSFSENRELLLRSLNMEDSFDKAVVFHEKDCLEVVVRNHLNSSEPYIYMFEFKHKKWVAVEKNTFDLINNFDEIKRGYFKYF